MEMKTIDVNALEWFDKLNGNSYFSAEIVLNYKLKDEKIIKLPFQYGYGDHYQYEALTQIKEILKIKWTKHNLSGFCSDNNIILRTNKKENCLKKELEV